MRTSRGVLCTIIFLLFSTFTAAWPWPRWLPELDSLIVRQNNDNDSPNPTTTGRSTRTTAGGSTITPAPSNTDSSDSEQTGSSNSRSGSGTGSRTSSRSDSASRTSTRARTTSFDARLPAGGVAMITPAVIDGPQYYKIGEFITFRWNYTSLLASPSAVNVVATCKENNQLYTIAANQTVTNATQAVTWDTGAYQATNLAAPLLTEKYTLIIYDAASSIEATAQAGYLAVYNQYTFGMYQPQPYTPLANWQCATCNAALGQLERNALGMMLGMCGLTVLSFTWFVCGTGVIW